MAKPDANGAKPSARSANHTTGDSTKSDSTKEVSYSAQVTAVRSLAQRTQFSEVREQLLMLAAQYEQLAQHARNTAAHLAPLKDPALPRNEPLEPAPG